DADRDVRQQVSSRGIDSNIVLALARGPEGSVWAATAKGVSHIQETGDPLNPVQITNFSSLDGLATPVRDIATQPDGTVWLATDGGVFRLSPQAGRVEGHVRDATGAPVVGADVIVLGTPFRAVTDVAGQFVLPLLPLGPQRLQVDSHLAAGGP